MTVKEFVEKLNTIPEGKTESWYEVYKDCGIEKAISHDDGKTFVSEPITRVFFTDNVPGVPLPPEYRKLIVL